MFLYLSNKKILQTENYFILREFQDGTDLYLAETETETDPGATMDDYHAFQIIDGNLPVPKDCFAVFNHIPVLEEGRSQFEARFLNRARKIEQEPGFLSIKVCRPLNSDTYIVITCWEKEDDFVNWQSSSAYIHAHKKRGTSEGIDKQQPEIFPRPSFVKKYFVIS
ncbi:antibiotic biosynthesis monooxygenase family protein [Aquibacillus kalidii]|uniref:antibiotic biosynthesis monooxygenase family protein n=1 Tax=Aquibacillus kalidii TaxID=2762597 RepID=UPI0016440BDD|nr:antibiotic biosynthesis monooxygenase [Aquibacillus kalidii]